MQLGAERTAVVWYQAQLSDRGASIRQIVLPQQMRRYNNDLSHQRQRKAAEEVKQWSPKQTILLAFPDHSIPPPVAPTAIHAARPQRRLYIRGDSGSPAVTHLCPHGIGCHTAARPQISALPSLGLIPEGQQSLMHALRQVIEHGVRAAAIRTTQETKMTHN